MKIRGLNGCEAAGCQWTSGQEAARLGVDERMMGCFEPCRFWGAPESTTTEATEAGDASNLVTGPPSNCAQMASHEGSRLVPSDARSAGVRAPGLSARALSNVQQRNVQCRELRIGDPDLAS